MNPVTAYLRACAKIMRIPYQVTYDPDLLEDDSLALTHYGRAYPRAQMQFALTVPAYMGGRWTAELVRETVAHELSHLWLARMGYVVSDALRARCPEREVRERYRRYVREEEWACDQIAWVIVTLLPLPGQAVLDALCAPLGPKPGA